MKKYSISLFILFCSCISSIAQDIKWSSVLEDKDNNFIKVIGQNEEGFYMLKSNISFEDERDKVGFRSRHYSLAFFTNEMVLKWTHAIESPLEDGRIISVTMVNEKVLVTFSLADKKQKIYRLYAQYLDNDGAYADSSKIIYETGYVKINDKEKPDIYISQNQNRIASAFRTMTEDKEQQSFHVNIMDSSLTIIYQKDFTVPFNEKKFVSQNLVLSNAGGFYMLGIRYTNDKKVKAPGESSYLLYYCNSKEEQVNSEELHMEEKFLTDASLTFDNINHKIVVAGFYSDISAYTVAGTFYYALRADTVQKAEIRIAAFNPQYLQKFHGEVKQNNKELLDYSINRIILRRDGGAVIIAEGISSTYSSYYDYFTQMYITHKYYLYGNIIALSVNPNGSILWSNVIPKDQESRDDGGYYSSYCNDIYGDKMFFVYNKYIGDNPSVLVTTINSKGEQATDVFMNEEEHVLTIPMGGKQIAEDEIVMPALKEGKLRFLKITF